MSSAVREALEGYVAGRLKADRVVAAVATAYYGDGEGGKGEELKALVEVIERAAPGVVELGGSQDRPGFAVKLAERPFPKQYEGELRRAAETLLGSWGTDDRGVGAQHAAPLPTPGLLGRLMGAIRRLFTASS
jgi:hypothetical protein